MNPIAAGEAIGRLGRAAVGGKASVLAEMIQAGFTVPPFIVVMPDAFDGSELYGGVRHCLAGAMADLPGARFAVRSSGRMEDGAQDSHAGQFLSELDVPREDVAAAVSRVFASGGAASVARYRAARGRDGLETPSVIVQAMVAARAAGVAFAADPVSGRRDRVVVAAVPGLAETLVSGEDSGETWVFALPGLEAFRRPAGATALSAQEAAAVARLCLRATAVRGAPQDIEWAFAADNPDPILLQSRPITTALRPAAAPETALLVLDNSNIVESYPGLVSPLTFSFAVHAYRRVYRTFLALVGVRGAVIDDHAAALDNMLSRLDGRMFYNLGNWYRLLSLLPFFASNRAHMDSMMGVADPVPAELTAGMPPPPGMRARLRMVWRLGHATLRLRRIRASFLARVAHTIPARPDPVGLQSLTLSQLAAEYRRVEAALLDRWDAPIVNDFLCMMAFGASRRLMQRWGGARGIALHNDVMIGQGDIVSAVPARLIREMGQLARTVPGAREALASGDPDAAFGLPELGTRLRSYIETFGDRRIGELKLEQPTLAEDPSPLFQAVLAAVASHTVQNAPRHSPEVTLAEFFAGRPIRRLLARQVLGYAKARVRDRENLRFERTRIFGHARRVFRGMGQALTACGLLDHADDVFYLTVAEILGAAEGSSVTTDIRALASLRRTEHEACSRLPDPAARVLVRGPVIDAASRIGAAPAAPERGDPTERTGTPCGGGVATGIVRVIRDPLTEQLRPGEILVARHTDPGWICHFAHAGAVVVERGSVLSHSAIVSRELGIPCVVALAGACSWLATGDRVRVDGGSGVVRKCDE